MLPVATCRFDNRKHVRQAILFLFVWCVLRKFKNSFLGLLLFTTHIFTIRLPVNSSHGYLITRSCCHTVNSSPVNSSQTRLITQSTRHKRAHNKTTSTSRNHLHAVSLRRHPETVLNMDGVITAICVTLMISLFVQGQKAQKMYTADSRSWRQITLLRKARSTRHNAMKHDGQLVARFYDVTSWPCDELTGSPQYTKFW